jgi:hypothetical protein
MAVNSFLAELESWRAEHPGWTQAQQIEAFPLTTLWHRAGGRGSHDGQAVEADETVYRRLVEVAGYQITREGS